MKVHLFLNHTGSAAPSSKLSLLKGVLCICLSALVSRSASPGWRGPSYPPPTTATDPQALPEKEPLQVPLALSSPSVPAGLKPYQVPYAKGKHVLLPNSEALAITQAQSRPSLVLNLQSPPRKTSGSCLRPSRFKALALVWRWRWKEFLSSPQPHGDQPRDVIPGPQSGTLAESTPVAYRLCPLPREMAAQGQQLCSHMGMSYGLGKPCEPRWACVQHSLSF